MFTQRYLQLFFKPETVLVGRQIYKWKCATCYKSMQKINNWYKAKELNPRWRSEVPQRIWIDLGLEDK